MRKSDLKKEIKEYIYEILSEDAMSVIASTTQDEENAIKTNPKINSAVKKGALDALKSAKPGQAITVPISEEDEDREPTKAELAKEKVKTVSKFKISNSEFEDFKTKLKTLVKKIKDMDEGDERTKKMAALKQFIKKPELVKAFKERDVEIDTDGLVG